MVAELISQREEEEALQLQAEERLAAEQAARAEEDARLRELYPLEEDELEAQGTKDGELEVEPVAVDGESAVDAEAEAAPEAPEATEEANDEAEAT